MGTTPLWVPVAGAVIAAAAALTGILLSATTTSRRDREARRAEHESRRLAELVDAALDLREATHDLAGKRQATATPRAYSRAEAVFVVASRTVRSPVVQAAAAEWARLVGELADDPSHGVDVAERSAWRALLVAVAAARRECL